MLPRKVARAAQKTRAVSNPSLLSVNGVRGADRAPDIHDHALNVMIVGARDPNADRG